MFKLGDKVEWASQSGGSLKVKRGEVVKVVAPKTRPNFMALDALHNSRNVYGGGSPRNHESYIVKVQEGNRKPVLYWPRVSGLMAE